MKPIPQTRTELIESLTSEKIQCMECKQSTSLKQRSDIFCSLIPRHPDHVVLECTECGDMTTIDKKCSKFNDLRELMKINQYELSSDEKLIPEWMRYYANSDMETEGWIYPSIFNWEKFWKEIQTHTDWRSLIGFKDKLIPDFGYSFDIDSGVVVVSHPEEGRFKISLSDFKQMHEKMEKNRVENKDWLANFSDLELFIHVVWRSACRGKIFWEKENVKQI
ncbi:MAG: hypothetical protein OEM89_09650 [Nitrosopumilus sp.]|nr:hypothetical protein [Nitrosopumilus sp.]